jgi:hypothetical protein
MKYAQRYGVINTLKKVNRKKFAYPEQKESSDKIVRKILENYKTQKK